MELKETISGGSGLLAAYQEAQTARDQYAEKAERIIKEMTLHSQELSRIVQSIGDRRQNGRLAEAEMQSLNSRNPALLRTLGAPKLLD
jgi:hypothetical protein